MAQAEFSAEELAQGDALFRSAWEFVLSAPSHEFLPPMRGLEVAFAGRSNVGKSSLINALVGHRGLARTSNTPGRTQELNYFRHPRRDVFIVDMPGYGFAQAPKEKVAAWTELVKGFLRGRQNLARVFLLVDARHGLKAVDEEIMALLDTAAVSYQAVLTKADKVKPHELARVIGSVEEKLATHAAAYPFLIVTSSETGLGIPDLRAATAQLLAERGA
ncbi:MAG: ribosome biogenesis GTP-binding protein YihA/YsxC [Hyphomicrobiaceae bacterium]|nr:ribosome biogenesis GTP-binding protein YihA/YsxC [Hyphomicrobiaceae bacterium]